MPNLYRLQIIYANITIYLLPIIDVRNEITSNTLFLIEINNFYYCAHVTLYQNIEHKNI